jgi:hypothetical protein
VRVISGFTKPSKVNEEAFLAASTTSTDLAPASPFAESTAVPKNCDEERVKAKARGAAI